jgi:hypothetical protein
MALAVVNSGWGLLELERLEPTLEDVFLHLTRRNQVEARPAEPVLAGAAASEGDEA